MATVSKNTVGSQKARTFAKRGFSSSSSTEALTESAFSIHWPHAQSSSSGDMFIICRSLAILCAPKSGAKTGEVGFWKEAEVVKTSLELFSNVGST